jgi:uridine kinase
MRRWNPHLIGIAGITGSGKSLLARSLKVALKRKSPAIVSCDSYYADLSHLPPEERERKNFDTPEALDRCVLRAHLEMLKKGKAVRRPAYDFATHTRKNESVEVGPSELIIIEGLFVLYIGEIRELLDTKVFVELEDHVALSRRVRRDVSERGRTRESVIDQYNNTVKPMAEKYVLPSHIYADVLVDGADSTENSVKKILHVAKL